MARMRSSQARRAKNPTPDRCKETAGGAAVAVRTLVDGAEKRAAPTVPKLPGRGERFYVRPALSAGRLPGLSAGARRAIPCLCSREALLIADRWGVTQFLCDMALIKTPVRP